MTEAAHSADDWRLEADVERAAANFQSRAVEMSQGGKVVDILGRWLEVKEKPVVAGKVAEVRA